ncbi:Uncharacterised protein [Serratia quinivorans]|jgi:hypothetical protein|uniref:Uncharacterized protein n=1 Tax=Serratia quinivorans TaxID=137545 RepID=A0A380AVN2_9GAMM|nr:hypothetical protein [Serratia proteamaculans]RYM60175.1 hypothetical protein BSR03_17175 [Serratia proteamaculans]SUI88138.1 Uncharacterised protein [Serratia quinivorans]
MWEALLSMFGMGDTAAGAASVGAQVIAGDDPGLQAGLSASDIAELDRQAAPPVASDGMDDWVYDAIKPLMGPVMNAALRPDVGARAPVAPSGHGVNVNTNGIMKPVDVLGKAANNNPLDELNKWSALFK